jgi:hypothetical protein
MTKIKKAVLSLAVAAALGGAISSANAVNLATDGLGDVLLYPYYTARNGWNSLIHIVNTSSVATIAVKVRFQEAQNTRDVLDFTLVLSPNDVWTGYVTNTANGPRLKKSSSETSCTSPVMPSDGFAFSTYGFGGGTDLTRTEEGHVTVIEMGSALTGTAIDTAAKAKDCTTIDAAFTKANIDATSNQFGEPLNALKGQFSLVRVDAGLSMGGAPVTLANFFTPTVDYAGAGTDGETVAAANGFTGNFGVTNLIAAQEYPDFLLPTLNDANPLISLVQNDTQGALQETLIDPWTNPVDAVSAVLMRSNVMNEWSINPSLGVESYWVVSFPTKFHYVDANAQPTQAELDAMVGGGPANAPYDQPAYVGGPAPFSTLWTDANRSCDTVTFQVYDRSEGTVSATGTSISPAPPIPPRALCNEVNVLSFSPTANLLGSAVAQAVDVSALVSQQPFGWLNLKLPVANPANALAATNTYLGLPVTGFVLWSRDFGIAANNYGHLVDHAYMRNVNPTTTTP